MKTRLSLMAMLGAFAIQNSEIPKLNLGLKLSKGSINKKPKAYKVGKPTKKSFKVKQKFALEYSRFDV